LRAARVLSAVEKFRARARKKLGPSARDFLRAHASIVPKWRILRVLWQKCAYFTHFERKNCLFYAFRAQKWRNLCVCVRQSKKSHRKFHAQKVGFFEQRGLYMYV